ncbi:uncharacterized protein with NRDE domain [Sphingobium xanthum]|jgi:uncharacterized protein with NRDE domain|uniref:NRDE family protein n=1 Tax=Sphingobium xanthum TaxID=1387165 RepID=UPI001C8CBF91|nr:NRDE family protein [Sphingobium xanthum]
MCVLAFAWNAHPHWRLVLAGNRDELHARPAAAIARWPDATHVIAGRDLEAGGTWLGISDQGRLAVVTNLRGYGPPEAGRASRGALVSDLLTRNGSHNDPARIDPATFNPFNLILADPAQALFLTNRPIQRGPLGLWRRRVVPVPLTSGIHGVSNGAFDAPWPKMLQLKAAMADWLVGDADDFAPLFSALRSETLPPLGVAPDQPSDVPQEAQTSPIFIRRPVYGTRCSTVVAIATDGTGHMIERRFDPDGGQTGESLAQFRWPPLITLAGGR